MKKYKTIIRSISTIALTGLWLVCPAVNAQDRQSTSEVSVSVGGVTSSLNYEVPGADVRGGVNPNFGIDYTYYFSDYVGLSIGAEYQRYSAKAQGNDLSGAYTTTDFEGESFEFRYRLRRYEEEQKMDFVNIPLMLVFRNPEHGIYLRAGAKVGLPVSGKFTGKYNVSSSGYYPQYNGELFDPEFMGFGDFNNLRAEGDKIDLKPSYILAIEFGIMHRIGKGNFYSGLYLDYGLNDIADTKKNLVDYTVTDTGAGFTHNSILNSDNVGEIKTRAFGVKLRYSFLNF